jgi:branched-chain amino acid transport system ATP-binding protein
VTSAASQPVLDARDVVAGYVPDLPILRGVSVQVNRGEVVTVIGPNGAGKSTLVKAIAGLVHIDSGGIRVDGREATNTPTHKLAAAGIAYVPQVANVFTSLTVHENLRAGGHCGGDLAARIESAYAMFPDLAARRRAKGRVLSDGQRQMLALARALLTAPRLIMLDEPSAGLAPRLVGDVLRRVRALADHGVAVLMIEQNAKAALSVSDRGYVLAEGVIQLGGPAAALLDDPNVGAIYLGARRLHA